MQKLNDKPENNPFKVPENYFEEVNLKIISATAGNEKSSRRLTPANRFRTTLLIAASIAGFILIGYSAVKILIPDKKNTQVSEVLQEISPDSYINDIDISSLEEDASSLVLSEEGPDVSKSDIVDYLLNENIEINEIYEHL
jgi:hypothetical protein